MGLKWFKAKLSDIRHDQFLRFDVDYLEMHKYFNKYKKNKFLSDYITFIETGKAIKREDYSDSSSEYAHVVVRNITSGKLILKNLVYLKKEKGEELKSYQLKKGDILIAISSNVGTSCLIEKDYDLKLTLSHYIARIRVNYKEINPKLLVYYLNSKLIQQYFRSVETGKTLKNLSKVYIHRLPVVLPNEISKQNEIANKIITLEQEIVALQNSKKDKLGIINQVFGEAFGFDWEKFEQLKRQKVYKIKLSDLKVSSDLRSTTKFHSIKYDFLNTNIFKKNKFSDFTTCMTLGRQIKPDFYENKSDWYYIMPNSVKTFKLNTSLMKPIKKSFFEKLKHIQVKQNDILLVASGEGSIGKSAIYNSDKQAITSQFIMKIELQNKKLVPYFHYYMQTSFFQLTVEKFKKGMGNMTNIFVSQVKDFPVLFDRDKVDEILKKIEIQIELQNSINLKIAQKRVKIDKLLETTIKQSTTSSSSDKDMY